jgi:hypothetical protein
MAIAGIAWLSYANSLDGALIFDDSTAIKTNKDVLGKTSLSTLLKNDFWGLAMSRPDSMKSYRPITVLSFRMNHNAHGLEPFGFHCVNVILHGLVSILLFFITIMLLGDTRGDAMKQSRRDRAVVPAFACAAIFAAHPVHTDAVSSVVGRAEVLSGLFFLLALGSFSVFSGRNFDCPRVGMFLAMVFTACAMFSKEQGIAALPICAAYNILFVYRIDPSNIFATLPQAKLGDQKRTLSSLVLTTVGLTTAFGLLLAGRVSIGVGIPKVGYLDTDGPPHHHHPHPPTPQPPTPTYTTTRISQYHNIPALCEHIRAPRSTLTLLCVVAVHASR